MAFLHVDGVRVRVLAFVAPRHWPDPERAASTAPVVACLVPACDLTGPLTLELDGGARWAVCLRSSRPWDASTSELIVELLAT